MTTSTEGISRPLEATSVAIRIDFSPVLNLFKLLRRIYCDILPWILAALKLRNFSMITSFKLALQVDVKIMIFLPASCVNKNTK